MRSWRSERFFSRTCVVSGKNILWPHETCLEANEKWLTPRVNRLHRRRDHQLLRNGFNSTKMPRGRTAVGAYGTLHRCAIYSIGRYILHLHFDCHSVCMTNLLLNYLDNYYTTIHGRSTTIFSGRLSATCSNNLCKTVVRWEKCYCQVFPTSHWSIAVYHFRPQGRENTFVQVPKEFSFYFSIISKQ